MERPRRAPRSRSTELGDGGLPLGVWIDGNEAVAEACEAMEKQPRRFQLPVRIPVDAATETEVTLVMKAGDFQSPAGVVLTLN